MNKKTIVKTTTNENNNNDAILMIKESIKNARDSYRDFIAGGVYLLMNDAGGRDALHDIVKREFADSEWQSVKRQYNRRISACITLHEHRNDVLTGKTASEIREWLTQNNITTAYIDNLQKVHANQKDKKTTPSPVKTTTPQKASESAESDDEKSDVQKAWDAISVLNASEWQELAKLADSQGYFFTFGKKPVKQESDLYGCKKAINS